MAKQRKLSEVFLDVLPHISKTNRFVCWAISSAWRDGAISKSEMYRAKDHIEYLLAGANTVEEYLRSRHCISTRPATSDALLDYRRRWVAHIINTLEAEGN